MVTVHFGENFAGGVFAKHPRKRCCALPCCDGIRAGDAGRGKSFHRPGKAVFKRRTRNKGETREEWRLHSSGNGLGLISCQVFDRRLIAPWSRHDVSIEGFRATCVSCLAAVWLALARALLAHTHRNAWMPIFPLAGVRGRCALVRRCTRSGS